MCWFQILLVNLLVGAGVLKALGEPHFDMGDLVNDTGVDDLVDGDHRCVLEVVDTVDEAEAGLQQKATSAAQLSSAGLEFFSGLGVEVGTSILLDARLKRVYFLSNHWEKSMRPLQREKGGKDHQINTCLGRVVYDKNHERNELKLLALSKHSNSKIFSTTCIIC